MSLASLLLVTSLLGTPSAPTPQGELAQRSESSRRRETPRKARKKSSANRVLLDRLVASVNGDIVTLSELRATAKPFLSQNKTEARRKQLYSDILDQLINEKLMDQQVKEANIEVTDAELDAAVEDILRQNSLTRDQLNQAVAARGITFDSYLKDVRSQLIRLKLVDMKVRSKIVIPEDDLKAEYERRARDDEQKVKVGIAHILLRFGDDISRSEKNRLLSRAHQLRSQIVENKTPFEELAKTESQGPTAAKGGSLGELEEESLLPELATAVKKLSPGEISSPIMTPNGIHIVKLESRRKERSQSFDQMRATIYQAEFKKRVDEQMKLWLSELRRSSAVEVLKPIEVD